MKTAAFSALLLFFSVTAACAADAVRSTSDAQSGVALTVYNNDLGLVRESRKIDLPAGQGTLEFMDVAQQIQPVTVHVEAPGFRVLEQNYEYDLMSPEKILDKYVGKNVKLVTHREHQDRDDVVDATLLSNGGQIYRIGGEIHLGHEGYRVVPEIPDNLISKPTLVWLFDSAAAGSKDVEVSYLTGGIGWKADYVVVLDEKDEKSDISGWVTIDNRSGASYKDAALKLVAGEVNRVLQPAPAYDAYAGRTKQVMMMEARAPQFQEKAFFEYHLYDLQRKTTVKNNQTKQIALLEAPGVGVKKEYVVEGIEGIYTQQWGEPSQKQDVHVKLTIKNSKENGLGQPLPGGVVRLYKKDDDGSQQFVGEDSIEHTAADEEVKLETGKAFDVVAERTQTDFKQLTSRAWESAWLVSIRNHKDEDVVVKVTEPFAANWEIVEKSHDFKKTSAFTGEFSVPVPKKGTAELRYRVRVEYK